MKRNLKTLKECTNERQFTQLAYDRLNKKFVISAFFRITGVFLEKEDTNFEDAERLYTLIIK